MLQFYVQSLAAMLAGQNWAADELIAPLNNAFRGLAAGMAGAGCDYISRPPADEIVRHAFGSYGTPVGHATWLDTLLRAGALRVDPDPERLSDPATIAENVVRFAFQRFGDALVAGVLIATAVDAEGLARSFAQGGALEPLLSPKGNFRGAPGVLAALTVLVPESFGCELIDILPGGEAKWWSNGGMQEAFERSIISRAVAAWTQRSRELFNSLHYYPSSAPPQLRVMAQVAAIETHPLNADTLHRWLIALPLADGDAFWTVGLSHIGGGVDAMSEDATEELDPHPIHELIEWAWRAPKEGLPDEALRLAGLFLCWCFTATHRNVRDRATRAVGAILLERPRLFPLLMARLSTADDPYVMERLLGAAYGVACTRLDKAVAEEYAHAIDQHLIVAGNWPRGLVARDFARGIIEAAARLSMAEIGDLLEKARPPYPSPWPLTVPSEGELKALVLAHEAIEINDSVLGFIGDFGRYEARARSSSAERSANSFRSLYSRSACSRSSL
jgi:hypothetical protein